MSTVAEIEAAIAKLPPDDVRTLQEWLGRQAPEKVARKWSSEELVEGARRMLEEPDPAKADLLWEEVVAGFYGDTRA